MAPRPMVDRVSLPGLPGQKGRVYSIKISSGEYPSPEDIAGGKGEYQVIFTLARQDIDISTTGEGIDFNSTGSSFLRLGASIDTRFPIPQDCKNLKIGANDQQLLSYISISCEAQNFDDAQYMGHDAIMPIISMISLKLDMPMPIASTKVREISTGSELVSSRVAFPTIEANGLFEIAIHPELRPYAALYREAVSTESVIYEFLCYYKLIESIKSRRKVAARAAKKKGLTAAVTTRIYPQNEFEAVKLLNEIYGFRKDTWDNTAIDSILVSEAGGREFEYILELAKDVRDNIAHFFMQNGPNLIHIDDLEAMARTLKWLAPLKTIARALLIEEFPEIISIKS